MGGKPRPLTSSRWRYRRVSAPCGVLGFVASKGGHRTNALIQHSTLHPHPSAHLLGFIPPWGLEVYFVVVTLSSTQSDLSEAGRDKTDTPDKNQPTKSPTQSCAPNACTILPGMRFSGNASDYFLALTFRRQASFNTPPFPHAFSLFPLFATRLIHPNTRHYPLVNSCSQLCVPPAVGPHPRPAMALLFRREPMRR